jgi:hypothetical protein
VSTAARLLDATAARQHPETKTGPCVPLTFRDTGGQTVLPKPYTPRELAVAVRRQLEAWRARPEAADIRPHASLPRLQKPDWRS